MKNPFISLILIVKNDVGVFDTIEYLLKHTSNREIIVVDSSSKLLPYPDNLKNNISLIHFKSKTAKKITIPEQRNTGVNHAKGDIIVFIDASCKPDKNWLPELIRPILNDGENIVAGSIYSSTTDKHHDIRNKFLQGKKYLTEAPTMNLAVKKDVFKKIGLFDESFDYGSDVDFTMRAVEHGYKIRYISQAKLYHDWGDFHDEMKRAFRYGEARVNIYRKHRSSIVEMIIKDPTTIIYPLFIVFLPLAIIFPWYILLIIIPFIKNVNNYPLQTTILNLVYGTGIIMQLLKNI